MKSFDHNQLSRHGCWINKDEQKTNLVTEHFSDVFQLFFGEV